MDLRKFAMSVRILQYLISCFSGYSDTHPAWNRSKHLFSASVCQEQNSVSRTHGRTYSGNPLSCLRGRNTWHLTEFEASNSSFLLNSKLVKVNVGFPVVH